MRNVDRGRGLRCLSPAAIFGLLILAPLNVSAAADYAEAVAAFRTGQYAEALEQATTLVTDRPYSERHWRLKLELELLTGRYADSLLTYEQALKRFPTSLQLRWLGAQALRFNDNAARAATVLAEIPALAQHSSWRYGDLESRIILGKYFLHQGADAKQVLNVFYDPLKKSNPRSAVPYLASAQLAIGIHDYQVAAEELKKAVELDPENPDIHFAIAQAYESSDSDRTQAAIVSVLEINPVHFDTLLHLAEKKIDSEAYTEADELLTEIIGASPHHPQAWALRAVLAHLENDFELKRKARENALYGWPQNPQVDSLIGRKLSEKYRFREGAEHQRQALAFDPANHAASIQLCQDLLRLGQEEEGWKLAEVVAKRNQYNVLAHNLLKLRERLDQFATLADDRFIVRMDRQESEIYGPRVLRLLNTAYETLNEKYNVSLAEPVVVEIFPEQPDFAIRTFGMPGGAGFLGVCFGRVITANSPASRKENPVNWESVLWHEYCHVVTLSKTLNRMPRWLSEGISVYEERQRDPNWGQRMTPQYREMILGEDLTPVSQLSGAFLSPKSALHLQFAYYESSLVVQFLVEQFGAEALNAILEDLGKGLPINDALQRHTVETEQLDKAFAKYARDLATAFGSGVDWSVPELPENARIDDLNEYLNEHPTNLAAWRARAVADVSAGRMEEAVSALERTIELLEDQSGGASAYRQLARIYEQRDAPETAADYWRKVLQYESDAVDALTQLLKHAVAVEDHAAVMELSEQMLAIDPLRSELHDRRVAAAREIDQVQRAADSLRALIALGPSDPARMHFELAEALLATDDTKAARRELLKALEIAPRYADALQMLLELNQDPPADPDEPQAEPLQPVSDREESP